MLLIEGFNINLNAQHVNGMTPYDFAFFKQKIVKTFLNDF